MKEKSSKMTERGTRRRRAPAPEKLAPVLEDCFAVDLREWQRADKLHPSNRFEKFWNTPGRSITAALGVFVREQDMVLLFKRFDQGYHHLPWAEEAVALKTTPNKAFGPRLWFVCPGCDGRALKLFAHTEVRFRCKTCTGLSYRVDHLSRRDRQSLRLEKINDALGVPHWFPSAALCKPPALSRAAFNKLREERIVLEAAGVRELGWLFDSIDARRRERAAADQRRYGSQMKDGVLYLDSPGSRWL
jgi:hypothetical protein